MTDRRTDRKNVKAPDMAQSGGFPQEALGTGGDTAQQTTDFTLLTGLKI